jgi:hypothetical protein
MKGRMLLATEAMIVVCMCKGRRKRRSLEDQKILERTTPSIACMNSRRDAGSTGATESHAENETRGPRKVRGLHS